MDNKQKILFVDDEESILEIASEYFCSRGYQVITAKTGLEALKFIKTGKIDCCFTDINMPEMSGLELVRQIKLIDNTIPVIVITGYPSMDNVIHTLKNGVVDFLIKPVNLKQMEICLRRVLREQRIFIENMLLKKEVKKKAQLEKINNELLSKVDELNILNKIMIDFNSINSSHDVFKRIVEIALEVTKADKSVSYIIAEGQDRPFEITASVSDHKNRHIKKSENISGFCVGSNADENEALSLFIMENVADKLPLIISKNNGDCGLPVDIHSFMMVPMKIKDNVFGVLVAYKNKDVKDEFYFNEKDLYYLSFMAQTASYTLENLALYENIYENLFSTIYAFVKALEARDLYTQQHSERVAALSVVIAKEMGCSQDDIYVLECAARLHDIGKIGIRDDILLKPGKLTDKEFKIIMEHPNIGANIVGQLGLWNKERQIIKSHHERYDGTGYPDGLKQEDIPLLARILSLADAYDSMVSDRAYRKKMEESDVLKILKEGSGTHFDPKVVDIFFKLYNEGKILFKQN